MTNMDFILSNLKQNKVTLDIKTNEYEESYIYMKPKDKFEEIEDLMEVYKDISETQYEIEDEFIYKILLYLDNTLSLILDKSIFIQKFKSDLKDKLPNYISKIGRDKKDILNAIEGTDDREPLYHYIAYLFDKNIAIHESEDIKIIDIGKKECIYIDETAQLISMEDCLAKRHEKKKIYHIQQNTVEKLSSMLVKDLKSLAEELGCPTTKIENGKKKNLLKNELKELINNILNG